MKLLVTTGFGNIIQGGADIWVNNFIMLVLPKLRESYIIFVDGKRPPGFIPNFQHFHFHEEDILKSERLLQQCDEIYFYIQIIIIDHTYGNTKINGQPYLFMLIYLICWTTMIRSDNSTQKLIQRQLIS